MNIFRTGGTLLPVCLLAMSLAFLPGCPDDSVIKDGVVVVDDVEGLDVTSMSDGALQLESKLDEPLVVGDIVVGEANGGYLREVTSVAQKGTTVTAQTSLATLEDVVESGTLITAFGAGPEHFQAAGLKTKGDTTIIDLSGTDIYRDYGIAITLENGTLDCAPNFFMDAEWDNFKLETFDLSTNGTITLDLDLKIALDSATPLSGEWDLTSPILIPFSAAIGPVPIFGHVKMSFPIGVTGNLTGDTYVMSGLDITDTFNIDTHYGDGAWDETTVDLFNFDVNGHPLTWNIDLGGQVTVYIKVVCELSLYESAELELYVKPWLMTDIHILPSPASVAMTGGLDFGGWYGISVLGFDIIGDDFSWAGPSGQIFSWSQDYSDPLDWTSGSITPW